MSVRVCPCKHIHLPLWLYPLSAAPSCAHGCPHAHEHDNGRSKYRHNNPARLLRSGMYAFVAKFLFPPNLSVIGAGSSYYMNKYPSRQNFSLRVLSRSLFQVLDLCLLLSHGLLLSVCLRLFISLSPSFPLLSATSEASSQGRPLDQPLPCHIMRPGDGWCTVTVTAADRVGRPE